MFNRVYLQLKCYVPLPLKIFLKRITRFFIKPELNYLEFHLADHCNLNCKGCSHYSPLASPHYADIRQHEIDILRLKQLFSNICTIRLLGGEPLLHRDPASFINTTRSAFPKSSMYFVTNGILLSKAPASFWDACRNTNTTINITLYPPLSQYVEDWKALCEAERVNLTVTSVETFYVQRNLKGDSDKQKAFDICRNKGCSFLKEGQLYPCPMPATIRYFNVFFGSQIDDNVGIEFHLPNVSGKLILRQLSQPIETCKWCSYGFAHYPWSASNKVAAEWDAIEQAKETYSQLHLKTPAQKKRLMHEITLGKV